MYVLFIVVSPVSFGKSALICIGGLRFPPRPSIGRDCEPQTAEDSLADR
jgi:hypothetical protein